MKKVSYNHILNMITAILRDDYSDKVHGYGDTFLSLVSVSLPFTPLEIKDFLTGRGNGPDKSGPLQRFLTGFIAEIKFRYSRWKKKFLS